MMTNPTERTIELQDLSPKEATDRVHQEVREQGDISGIDRAVIEFTQLDRSTFKAEYAWVDGNLVIHFFLTPAMERAAKEGGDQYRAIEAYWLTRFPQALEQEAREFFQDTSPRVQAKYTSELASWWFRALGYGDRIDPEKFALTFFDRLHAQLGS
jgi:hypothetical protein